MEEQKKRHSDLGKYNAEFVVLVHALHSLMNDWDNYHDDPKRIAEIAVIILECLCLLTDDAEVLSVEQRSAVDSHVSGINAIIRSLPAPPAPDFKGLEVAEINSVSISLKPFYPNIKASLKKEGLAVLASVTSIFTATTHFSSEISLVLQRVSATFFSFLEIVFPRASAQEVVSSAERQIFGVLNVVDLCIAVLIVVLLGTLFAGIKNPENKRVWDIVKLLSGFLIGIAMPT